MSATVQVSLPGPLVWDLWKIAEARGIPVADVIREGLAPRPNVVPDQTALTRARVADLVEQGWDDGSIAVKLDRTRGYVADVRRRAGMKANKRGMVAG